MAKNSFLAEVTFKPLSELLQDSDKDLHHLNVQSSISHLNKMKFLQEQYL